jgi:hypothetical protein
MKVYLTYYRYDRGESYSVYNIDRSLQRAYAHWKEKDLPDFLGYGPDDVSQLYLIRCDISKTELEILKEAKNALSDFDIEFDNLMDSIHEEVDEGDVLCQTSGEECFEVLQWFKNHFRSFINPLNFWATEEDIPTDEDDLLDELRDILFDNDPIWDKVLKAYIQTHY